MTDREREMLQAALDTYGLNGVFREADDPNNVTMGPEVLVNERWQVIEDDEDNGLFEGDEGQLFACVVGAPEYHNHHVSWGFMPDGMNCTSDCVPYDNVYPV